MAAGTESTGSNWSPATTLSRERRKVSGALPVLVTTKARGRCVSGEAAGVGELSCHVTVTPTTRATITGVEAAETDPGVPFIV